MKLTIDSDLLREIPFHTNTIKLVWFCLMRDVGEDGITQTSALGISKEIGVNEKTVRNALKTLIEHGLIEASSPICTPILSPKKVRYKGQAIKLKHITICADKKQKQVRKKSDMHSDIESDMAPAATDYISPPFVAPEFREIWRRFIAYRKEIKKPYKSEASERTAYNKMVKMADNDPAVAEDMVERTILGQWQGLFKDKNYDNRNNNAQYRTPGCNPKGTDRTYGVAGAILQRIAARKNQ